MSPEYVWSFSSKYLTDQLLYHFENAYFELKQKHCFTFPVFQNRAVLYSLFSDTLLKTSVRLSCILNHISINFWYMVFWVHTSEAHAQRASVTCQVFFMSYCISTAKSTQVYVKTRVPKSVAYICEGKQLGKKAHVYIRSVCQNA